MMTESVNWIADFEKRLRQNTESLNRARSMLAELGGLLSDPASPHPETLSRMEIWIRIYENAVRERDGLRVVLDERRAESRAAVVRASAALLDDGGQAHA